MSQLPWISLIKIIPQIFAIWLCMYFLLILSKLFSKFSYFFLISLNKFFFPYCRYLLSTSQGSRAKNIQEVMPMIGARFFSQLEAATLHADYLEDQLARELDNGRLFRLLGKLGTVVDRPE